MGLCFDLGCMSLLTSTSHPVCHHPRPREGPRAPATTNITARTATTAPAMPNTPSSVKPLLVTASPDNRIELPRVRSGMGNTDFAKVRKLCSSEQTERQLFYFVLQAGRQATIAPGGECFAAGVHDGVQTCEMVTSRARNTETIGKVTPLRDGGTSMSPCPALR